MSDQKLRVRTVVTIEQIVDLDSYAGMTAAQAALYEIEERALPDRLMEFSEAMEYATFVDKLENLGPHERNRVQGHIVTTAKLVLDPVHDRLGGSSQPS